MSRKIIMPMVHLNGTSKDELIRLREDVYSKLQEVYDSLRQMAPNGRDYYLIPGAMTLATEQHLRRLSLIGELSSEIEQEIGHIENPRPQTIEIQIGSLVSVKKEINRRSKVREIKCATAGSPMFYLEDGGLFGSEEIELI